LAVTATLFSLTAKADEALQTNIQVLLEGGTSGYFVHVGPSLKKILNERSVQAKRCSIEVVAGDVSLGDGSATEHAIIRCPNVDNLGIRIQRMVGQQQAHILGYWTTDHAV